MNDRSRHFFSERAAEIVAAYGSDATRWPDGERATALAVVAGDPELVAARDAAAELDRIFADWARAPVAAGDSVAVASAAMRHRPAPVYRWLAGGGIAAALALVMVVVPPPAPPVATPHDVAPTVSDEQAFAGVFTPTPDEENSI